MSEPSTNENNPKDMDSFQRSVYRIIDQLKANRSTLFAVVAVSITLLVLFGVFQWSSQSREEKALGDFDKWSETLRQYEQNGQANPLLGESAAMPSEEERNKQRSELIGGFTTLAQQHSGTSAALMATWYLGLLHFDAAEYDKAAEFHQQYLKSLPSDSPFRAPVLERLAYTHEALAKMDEAADYFLKAAAIEENPLRDRDYVNAARLYEKQQNEALARKWYQHVVDEFPESKVQALARAKVASLSTEASE